MLQLNYIKENKQATIDSLKCKYFKNAEETIETLLVGGLVMSLNIGSIFKLAVILGALRHPLIVLI